jgi:retinol dehydrogenase-12
MATTWGEMFPPKPTFTETDLPSQHGRVFLVTGGSSGIGFELAKILYSLNARVYITSRSLSSAQTAISSILASKPTNDQTHPPCLGEICFLKFDLSDLSTIKGSVSQFLEKESRLDVVWHNAGVMVPATDELSKQGYHMQLAVNGLGAFLLQHYLTPILLATAALPKTPARSVRSIFVSSSGHRASPAPDGVNWDDINLKEAVGLKGDVAKYGQSKAMNVMHAHELARRHGGKIMALSLHPGSLHTGLQKSMPRWYNAIFGLLRHEPRFGALTELFAGLAPLEDGDERMMEHGGKNGAYILPWGRFGAGSQTIFEGLAEKGTGERLWKVCEKMLKEYL